MPGLRADYAWHARCLPSFHAAHRQRAGVAHPWPTLGPGVGQAAHRPGLGHSQARYSDRRENFGENMAGKLS